VLEDADSIFFGDCNASSNEQLNLSASASGDSGTDLESRGLSDGEMPYIFMQSVVDLGSSVNLSTSDPDLTVDCTNCALQGSAFGDVNNDGEDDMLLCTSDAAYIMYGPHSLSVALSLDDADVTISNDVGDASFCQSSSIADVTGDGVADMVIGGENSLYVVYGSSGLSASISLASSSVVNIISGVGVGDDILIKSDSISIYSSDAKQYTIGGSSSISGTSDGASGAAGNYLGCQLGSGGNLDMSPLAVFAFFLTGLIFFRIKSTNHASEDAA